MKKVLCIINPHSGTKRQKKNIETTVLQYISAPNFSVEFIYTQYAGHASEISKTACNIYDIIIAVGGDGTIHEIAQHIIHSPSTLAIVPMGSGNGLARFLKIPLSSTKAIQKIASGKTITIDTIKCNDEYVINVAGIGFDAHVGNVFNNSSKRGGINYIKLIAKEFLHFPYPTYTFSTPKKTFNRSFFIASIANSSQWGMNAHIAPKAKIADGKFDLVFIKKFPTYKSIELCWKLFSKKIYNSKYVETMQLEQLTIINNSELLIHLDGEPRFFSNDIIFEIQKKSLQIIIP